MIRTPKRNPRRDALADAKWCREQAEKLEAPSALGPRHDARVRASWNARAAEWREAEATYRERAAKASV